MEIGIVLSLLGLVWCIAVLCKVASVRSRKETYRFTQWDGGLMMRGTELSPGGALWFALFAAAVGAVALYQLVRWSQL
jgi:hypothetical protein